jgi:hypothetical protein
MARTFEDLVAEHLAKRQQEAEFERAARVAAARLESQRQPSVSDSQGRTFATEPSPLARQAQEQDMLARRLSEAEAVIQMKAARGEDVTRDLDEIGRLSTHAAAPLEQAPQGVQHAPPPQLVPTDGRMAPTTVPLDPSLNMAGHSQQEREILRANEDMVRNAQRLADRFGPIGPGMRI